MPAFLTEDVILSLYLIGVSLLALIFIILFCWPFIKRNRNRKHFDKFAYKKISKIVRNHDYYLINDFPLIRDNEVVANVDHAIFSDKFVYVIKTKYLGDIISANKNDNYWVSYDEKGNKKEFENPMLLNEARCAWFSEIKNIERSFFISIVLVNNDIQIKKPADLNSNNSFLCKKKNLARLIKKIEKRNVHVFNPQGLDKEVKSIAREIGREV